MFLFEIFLLDDQKTMILAAFLVAHCQPPPREESIFFFSLSSDVTNFNSLAFEGRFASAAVLRLRIDDDDEDDFYGRRKEEEAEEVLHPELCPAISSLCSRWLEQQQQQQQRSTTVSSSQGPFVRSSVRPLGKQKAENEFKNARCSSRGQRFAFCTNFLSELEKNFLSEYSRQQHRRILTTD